MNRHIIPICILSIYSALLIKVMVFKNIPLIRIGHLMLNFGGTQTGEANLVPFKTIVPYIFGDKGLIIVGLNLGGNILLLVPVGFLLPFIWQNISWKKTLLISVVAGLLIEGMQVIFQVGIFDIDDVILNALGVMVGYWVFRFFRQRRLL